MSEDNSLEGLGIHIPKPLNILTVKTGRRFMQLGSSPLYLALNYELLSFMNHVNTSVVVRILQKATSPDDEVILVGEKVAWDNTNKAFRNPKSVYPLFTHPASPIEVVQALKEDEFFVKLSNILDSVYDVQVTPTTLESGLLSLDYMLCMTENVRAQKTAIKI